jgi:hypothetical protein
MGFIRSVARHKAFAQVKQRIQNRREAVESHAQLADSRANPEKRLIVRQRLNFVYTVLDEMIPRQREILCRFYLEDQPSERICGEMKLSVTQYRLLKNRAKARFGELGKRNLLSTKLSGEPACLFVCQAKKRELPPSDVLIRLKLIFTQSSKTAPANEPARRRPSQGIN